MRKSKIIFDLLSHPSMNVMRDPPIDPFTRYWKGFHFLQARLKSSRRWLADFFYVKIITFPLKMRPNFLENIQLSLETLKTSPQPQ